MKFIKKDIANSDNFEVLDDDNNAITGLVTGDFTIKLYNPSGTEVSGSIIVSIVELENGLYRSSFTPNVIGNWLLVIYHTTYFPYGKSEDYQCVNELFDDLALESTVEDIKTETDKIQPDIIDSKDDYKADVSSLATSSEIATLTTLVTRILGLTQENFRIINPVYNSNHLLTSAIIKIYPTATDVNNDTNEIASYLMTTGYNEDGEMTSYKVIKN